MSIMLMKPHHKEIEICESVGINIEVIPLDIYFKIRCVDSKKVLFKQEENISKKNILKGQIDFELMLAYRKIAEMVLNKVYK